MEPEDRKPSMVILQENDGDPNSSQPQFPKGMAPKMLKLVKVLNDLESKLDPLISKQHHDVLSKLSSLERAKIGLMEVYTINSLYWVLMKTSGENIDATLRDDYKIEMGRLKEAQGKLAELEARAQRPPVDVRAAARFIHHGLGINPRRETQDVEMEQEYIRPERQQSWNSHMQNDYQEEVDGGEGYENQEEEPQLVAKLRNKKKKKKTVLEESQPTHTYYDEEGNCISGSQPEGEDQSIIPQELVKTEKKMTSVHTTHSLVSEKKTFKKKKDGKKPIETKGKLKKKKIKSENYSTVIDMNGLQAGESHSETEASIKGKKKRKNVEKVLEDEQKDSKHFSEEDGEVSSSVSNKKMKKKPKKEKTVNPEDISAFLDTSRGRINYEFEDDRDLNNKSRSWYEQGWT